MDIKKYLQNLDWWLVGAVCLLSLFGLICIASATRINLGESPANVIKQGVFFLIGIALMVIAANADYEYISQFTIPLYIVNHNRAAETDQRLENHRVSLYLHRDSAASDSEAACAFCQPGSGCHLLH